MKQTVLLLLLTCTVVFNLSAGEHWFAEKFSKTLVNSNGRVTDTARALNGKMVAVYFSASWCGPCRSFTPKLVEFYKQTAKQKNLEVVFVSCDRNKIAMEQYMRQSSMPWLALPFDKELKRKISNEFSVRGIPKLIVLSPNGTVITSNARGDVTRYGAKAVDMWKKTDTSSNSGSQNNAYSKTFKKSADETISDKYSNWKKGPTDQWHIRLDTAFSAAARQNKMIFVLTTGSNWCGWCVKLYREVLSSETFLAYANRNFILVYLDYPHGNIQPEYQRLYNEIILSPLRITRGAPAAFILSSNGRLKGRIGGYRELKQYMRQIQRTAAVRPSGPVPPEWVKYAPERLEGRLTALKNIKQKNAATARAATTEMVKKMRFQVVAWGFDKNKVNKPFSPSTPIRVPLNKTVYFKVRYQLPPQVNARIWLRADTSYCGSPAHFGKNRGEFVGLLAARKAAVEKTLKISVRLNMPESSSVDAVNLPCNIIWE